ncbi:MAG: PQQ-binding-like beta-propeller repeat protein [Gemmatimonadota bacterium]|nr:MAG: PQQ-binding-like beta-propeller repeat protein [Gemmatimonadota bacterium]
MARAPFRTERLSTAEPTTVWSEGVGSGIQGMPVLAGEAIIAATSDRYLEARSRQDGSLFWRKRLEGPPVSPIIIGDAIYTATEGLGELRALDVALGDDRWKQRFASVRTPLAMAGDTLFVATENGGLFAFDRCSRSEDPAGCRTPEGEPIWSTAFRGPPSAGPLVLTDWVVVVALDSLYLFDRFSGMRRAAAQGPDIAVGELASDGSTVFLATENGSLLAWTTPNLELLWQISGFGNFQSGPVLDGNLGYAVTRTGQVLAFDLTDGAARVIAECKGAVIAPPTLVRNGLLVGTLDGKLHFLGRDGESIWMVEFDGLIETPVIVHQGRILVSMYGKAGGGLGSPYRGKMAELR